MTDDLMRSNEKWNVAWLTKDETEAENLAARAQGFADAAAYWQWLADYVVLRKVP